MQCTWKYIHGAYFDEIVSSWLLYNDPILRWIEFQLGIASKWKSSRWKLKPRSNCHTVNFQQINATQTRDNDNHHYFIFYHCLKNDKYSGTLQVSTWPSLTKLASRSFKAVQYMSYILYMPWELNQGTLSVAVRWIWSIITMKCNFNKGLFTYYVSRERGGDSLRAMPIYKRFLYYKRNTQETVQY